MMLDYETRRDTVVTHAWEHWTRNGLRLDTEARRDTEKTVQDAARRAYADGMSDTAWLTATLDVLSREAEPRSCENGRFRGRYTLV